MLQKFSISSIASVLLWLMFMSMLIPTSYAVYFNETTLLEWNILNLASTPIMFTLIFDPMGLMFSCTVLLISANVLMFSSIYMKEDKFINRFTALVLLFVLSMNMLIYLPHLMVLLLGWDGLGIVSFILVIYYQNPKSLAAGMVTALTNRIGDVMLLLAIAWTLNQGHWNILHMWWSSESMYLITAIIVAAMTKSAQMPFCSWLPAAMAAPTPVSALVHSSTLVTAGVFLLIRFYPFMSLAWWFNPIILMVAVSTTLMAGLSAITECDMKKIIALSTLSQLGMMMASMGLNMVHIAYFHMLTHALFKALLFVCAGCFIHNRLHSQDLRWVGNLPNQLPTTTSCLLIANFALSGIPFMSGFYSKDMIIESSMFYSHNLPMIMLILFAAGLTAFYSIRFSVFVIWGPNNCNSYSSLDESNLLTTPMLTLATMSVLAGALILWITPMKQEMMMLSPSQKLITLSMVFLGVALAWMLTTSSRMRVCTLVLNPMSHYASCSMWFLVPLSTQLTMKIPMYVSHNYLKLTDQSWLEFMGGQGISNITNNSSNMIMVMSKPLPVNYLIMSCITFIMIMMTTL
nr:NADH dehydrogenase subunit 5 [Dendrobaena tellermanica]